MIRPVRPTPSAPPWEGAREGAIAFATIWTTGPDPAGDRALRLSALYAGALGAVSLDRVLRSAGEDDGSGRRTQRELGLTAADLKGGADPAAAAAELRAFLEGAAAVVVPDRASFEAWIARLSGAPLELLVVGLADAAALLVPGRLSSEGERLAAVLCGRAELARRPRAVLAADLRDALCELVGRVQALDPGVLGLIAHAHAEAHGALEDEDPRAALELALVLGLVERPSAWARGAALFAGGRALADGVLTAAWRAFDDLQGAASELRPAWGRAARAELKQEPLPVAPDEPRTLDSADRRLVDEILEEHLPRALGAGAGAYRPGQHAVAAAIAEGFGRRELLLVHAPTGTGKTLAYLVPAALWAYRNAVRVGVATFTRALQEQAVDREVPLARALLARAGVSGAASDLRVALLKGRENYLCWRALRLLAPDPGRARGADGSAHARLSWALCAAFALTDPDGDLDRMPRRAPLALRDEKGFRRALERLCAEARTRSGCCVRREDREDCGGRAALRRAERAHVVVTNHAFALARREFFRHLVFDECEHLHAQAHHAFSHAVPLLALREGLTELYKPGGSSRAPLSRAIAIAVPETEAAACLERCVSAQEDALDALDRLQRAIFRYKLWREDVAGLRDERDCHSLFREHVESGDAEELCGAHAELLRALADLSVELSELAEHLDTLPTRGVQRIRRSLDLLRGDLDERIAGVEAWIPRGEGGEPRFRDETFYDVETTPRGHDVLASRVLLPHEHLGRHYYPVLAGAVLISATTWIQGGFDASARYLGCRRAARPAEDEDREPVLLRTFRAPETFDYGRVLVCAPKDAPAPNATKRAALEYLARFVQHLGERTRGRILVLFTNADDCARAAELVQPFFAARRIPFWHQRMEGAVKEELSERFRATVDSVLFGLDTFWYGADFPGETLEHLVIARLPYGVPDRYHHAQCAVLGAAEQRGSIYMPRALAKFRQGFGRLMRKEEDKGTVFVLDPRVLDPRHRAFLRELPLAQGDQPGARLVRGDLDQCLREAFAHVGLTAELARRGLDRPLGEEA